MRWAAFLLIASTVWAQERLPFQDIPVGKTPEEVEIPTTEWFAGGLAHTDAVVVAEVQEVTFDVKQSASQVLLEEACTLRIDSMFGTMPELAGATMVKLHASYTHDTYLQLEPDWGVYHSLKRGQRVMALIHRYEGGPAIGSAALIVLTEKTKALLDILRRTALLPSEFTDADLEVLRLASPFLYQQFLAETAEERTMRTQQSKWRRNAMMLLAGISALAVPGIFVLRKRMK